MRTLWRITIIILLLVCISCSTRPDLPATPDRALTVLFFNDIHGHLRPFSVKTGQGEAEVGGIARLATLIETIREENQKAGGKTVLLIAGDILQGTPMSTTFKGAAIVDCFNRMGVEAATIGNHEFDFGLDNFVALQKQAAFPFLSANIVYRKTGRQLALPFLSIPITDKIHLTVIGVTTRDLLTNTSPANVAELAVSNPTQSVVETISRLSPTGPVIALSHCKHHTDRQTATAIPQLAAVIAGHDQVLFSPHRQVGDVPIFQAYENGRYLGRLDFQVDGKTGQARLVDARYIPVTADITGSPEIARIVDDYTGRMDSRFNQAIGRAAVVLDGERERIRRQETTLGNFVTDVMRESTGADIALINAGSFRTSINSGQITVADVFMAMPYANELVILELTGKAIHEVLNRASKGLPEDEDGGFLHVSGIAFTIINRRAHTITIGPDHHKLRPDATYRVVITDFLYDGGDGYTIFKDRPAVRTGLPLRELLVETIRQQKVIKSQVEGRIRRATQSH